MDFRPSILRSFLKKEKIFLKRSLSQNFLIDGNILKKIIDSAQISSKETLLEIGSGAGVLTRALLEKNAHVLAVEKDPLFASHLSSLKKEFSTLEIFEEDFLTFSLEEKITHPIKVVANLPYNITSELFVRFFELSSCFTTLFVMIQKEAAKRLLSRPKTKHYGAIGALIDYYCKARSLFDIPPTCFYPKPKVFSTLVELKMQRSLPKEMAKSFHKMLFRSFQQRRKKITSSLKELYPQEKIYEALAFLSLKEEVRPEELTGLEFFQLFDRLHQKDEKKISSIRKKESVSRPPLHREALEREASF
jgi:16S rRNA (adenine1518-N6/adenine1519-N6)-dimethyltransferase